METSSPLQSIIPTDNCPFLSHKYSLTVRETGCFLRHYMFCSNATEMYLCLSPCFFSIYFCLCYLSFTIFLLHLSPYYLTIFSLSHSLSFLSFEICAFWHPCISSLLCVFPKTWKRDSHVPVASLQRPISCHLPRGEPKWHIFIHCIKITFLKQWEIIQMYSNSGLKVMFLSCDWRA